MDISAPEKPAASSAAHFKNKYLYISVLLLTFALSVWQIAEITQLNSIENLRKTGDLRVHLYAGSLRDTLEKYRHLPYVLARDSKIISLLQNDIPPKRVNPHLEDFSYTSGALIFVLDRGGTTVATSNWRTDQSLLGYNFSFRPYFADAREGKPGGYYAVGMRTRQPGFFLSYPVKKKGQFIGVIVVKINLEAMQEAWKKSGETVIVSDAHGVIFLTSNADWKYFSLRSLPEETAARLQAQQYLNLPLTALTMTRKSLKESTVLSLDGNQYLEEALQLPEYGWRLHYLTNLQKVHDDVKAAVVISTILAFLIFLTLLYLRERKQKQISQQEAGKAIAIQEINERLREEIERHKETELNLRQTQKELIQAGKLAALGRMSAAIAHELNQPVTAIRTFSASCRVFLERSQYDKVNENINYIARLTDRMAKITGQLKTFARKSKGKEEAVNINTAIEKVLLFMQPQFEQSGVNLKIDLPQKNSLFTAGDSLQVEQVLGNLLHNGLDAMKTSAEKSLSISLKKKAGKAVITLSDSGPGIPEEVKDNLFDPFFTTKDIGEGLGLGLSICYGIIQEMDGSILAENNENGGASFIIELPVVIKDIQVEQ